MTTTDRIYQRYVSGLMHIGQATDAVRLALRLALDEASESTQPAPQPEHDWAADVRRLTEYIDAAHMMVMPEYAVDRAIELLRQNAGKVISAEKLSFWLEQNGLSDLNPYGADTAIELIESQREEISRMTAQLIDYEGIKLERKHLNAEIANLTQQNGQMNARIVELSDLNSRMRDEIALARGEITDLQTKLRATVHTGNGAGLLRDFDGVVVNPPTAAAAVELTPSAKNEDVSTGWMERFQARFADDQPMLDWLDGIAAGRNLFRNLPRDARWKLVQAVINDIRPRNGQSLTQSAFDAAKPEWMSSAAAASITFGGGKWDHVVLVAVQA